LRGPAEPYPFRRKAKRIRLWVFVEARYRSSGLAFGSLEFAKVFVERTGRRI
jgi:hypothetical protein